MFPLYIFYYSFLCLWTILSHNNSLTNCMLMCVLTFISFMVLRCFLKRVQIVQSFLARFLYVSMRKINRYLLESEGDHWPLWIFLGRLPQGWKRKNINQWVTCTFVPHLKVICHNNHLYSGIRSHWGRSQIMWCILG